MGGGLGEVEELRCLSSYFSPIGHSSNELFPHIQKAALEFTSLENLWSILRCSSEIVHPIRLIITVLVDRNYVSTATT